MIKNSIFLILILTTVSCGQLLQPKIALQQTSYNFGDILQGDIVTHDFILSNSGGDLLKISNVTASCGCTAAEPEKKELAPGESTKLTVKFNSSRRLGEQHKTVRVYSNDPQNPEMLLTITGVVVLPGQHSGEKSAVIFFPETQHDFGKINEGDKVDYTFRFINKGGSVLEIKDIKTSCGCTAALVSNDSLPPGQEGTIKVELNTENRVGKMSRTVTIKSNDPKDPSKILTIYADVIKQGS